MKPEEIEKLAEEVLMERLVDNLGTSKEKFEYYAAPYTDKNGRIKNEDMPVVCTTYAMNEAIKESYKLTVELLKRVLS